MKELCPRGKERFLESDLVRCLYKVKVRWSLAGRRLDCCAKVQGCKDRVWAVRGSLM